MTGVALLSSVRIWEFELQNHGAFDVPPFVGPLLRGVLGRSLFDRLGEAPATALFEPGKGAPLFRFDTPIGPSRSLRPGDRWQVRFVTFDLHAAQFFLGAFQHACTEGLGKQRARQEVEGLRLLAHGGGGAPAHPDEGAPLVEARAEELLEAGAIVVRLASPAELKRGGQRVRQPGLADVLRATSHRARELKLDTSGLPRFEDACEELAGTMKTWSHARWSEAQGREYGLLGAVGGLACRPTPSQARWLALAEVLGIGASTAYGMGVVRAEPLGAAPS